MQPVALYIAPDRPSRGFSFILVQIIIRWILIKAKDFAKCEALNFSITFWLGCQSRISLEATTGFEPVIRVLQTLALPLGHVAVKNG
jgi:hypothetical protein